MRSSEDQLQLKYVETQVTRANDEHQESRPVTMHPFLTELGTQC